MNQTEQEYQHNWTPVWEYLPPLNTPVLILTDYRKCAVAGLGVSEDLTRLCWVDYMRAEHSYGGVVAWQHLPTLPDENDLKFFKPNSK